MGTVLPVRAIITGVTGMVGEGVLHECLLSPDVEAVLVVNRKPCGISHPKLKEIVHPDFYDLSPIQQELNGYNACFFCLGVSSVGMKETEYFKVTYSLTLGFARVLCQLNAGMTFCYVSGEGTDSSEKGRSMWARVKGKTENDLMKLPFKQVFAFRPGYLHPTKGLKNINVYYKYITWLYPIVRTILPGAVNTLAQLGKAMINVARSGYDKTIIHPKDILILASQG